MVLGRVGRRVREVVSLPQLHPGQDVPREFPLLIRYVEPGRQKDAGCLLGGEGVLVRDGLTLRQGGEDSIRERCGLEEPARSGDLHHLCCRDDPVVGELRPLGLQTLGALDQAPGELGVVPRLVRSAAEDAELEEVPRGGDGRAWPDGVLLPEQHLELPSELLVGFLEAALVAEGLGQPASGDEGVVMFRAQCLRILGCDLAIDHLGFLAVAQGVERHRSGGAQGLQHRAPGGLHGFEALVGGAIVHERGVGIAAVEE